MAIAKKLNIKYSSAKLNACARFARKLHIFDALSRVQILDKKGVAIVKSVLEAARVNAIKQGMSEDRLFVKEIVIGKNLG